MRFIIKEQPYEKILAAGQYRYELDGVPTGAVESWRLTEASADYRFLRVDLDARAAQSGHTYLFHALLNAGGKLERLKYRFWGQVAGAKLQVIGDIVLDDETATAIREVNGINYNQVLDLPKGYRFWFPSVAGLHLAGWRGYDPKTAVILNNQIGGPDTLAAQIVEFEYYPLITDHLEMEAAGKVRQYSPWRLAWDNQWRVIMRDAESGWPIGMEKMGLDGEGRLTAVSSRHILYQRITKPGNPNFT